MPTATAISREKILQTARMLPAAPQAMAGLCELLQELNTDLGRIADQISVDAALAARVIRISNSVAFGGDGSVASVEDAVNRVGFGEILRLVGAATVITTVERNLAGYRVQAEALRRCALLHAIASEVLARVAELDTRSAYTAGLLRAVGMVVISRLAGAGLRAEDDFSVERHGSYYHWEGEHFGIASTEVTAMVLGEWRFPRPVVEAIRDHLLLDEANLANPFACLLNLAGGIVVAGGYALPGEAECLAVSPVKLAALGLSQEQWDDARVEALATYDRLASALC